MVYIIILTVKLLDPASILIAGIWGARTKEKPFSYMLIIALTTSLIVELFLTMTQITRDFGEGIVIGFIASYIHAITGRGLAILRCKKKSKENIES